MKAKKTLAVLLVAVMLLMSVCVSVNAANGTITANPVKTAYTDCEFFNPQGLEVEFDGETITYNPNDTKFAFIPALNDHLSADVTAIDVYYDNVKVGSVAITVAHVWGDTTYLDNNFHGQYCLGCGTVKERLSHNVTEFIPNDDGGLFIQQTQTGACVDCHAEITQPIPGSENFDSIFDFGNMTETEGLIFTYVRTLLVSLIQMLVGIN